MRLPRRYHFLAWVCAIFMAWLAPPASGLSVDPLSDCLDLCSPEFWAGASASDVASALAKNPTALSHRRAMLWIAVKSATAGAVAALLRTGAPPNARNGEYLLHQAARRNGAVVSVLLNAGAFPNHADDRGWTPLHEAVRWGRVGAVARLLTAGADPAAETTWGATAIGLAQGLGDDEGLMRLYRREYQRQNPPVSPPCGTPCKDAMLALFRAPPSPQPPCGNLCEAEFWKKAATVQIRSVLARAPAAETWTAPGGGPLHLALAAGADVEALSLLLDHGADPNARDVEDNTPLHLAARTPGRADAAALLVARGAIPDAVNAKDWTPLHAAAERAVTLDALRVLLDAGANPDIRYTDRDGDIFGVTPQKLAVSQPEGPQAAALMLSYADRERLPETDLSSLLHSALERGHPDTVKLLLDRGAHPDTTNFFGESALHVAAAVGNVEAMRVLLDAGSHPNRPVRHFTFVGGPPIGGAVSHPEAVGLLLAYGADPNGEVAGTAAVEPPLHRAARECVSASLELLLTHDAAPNIRDEKGRTALHHAVQRVADSRDSVTRKRNWRTWCDSNWGGEIEQCIVQAKQDFKKRFEARQECETNIATQIRYGANPSIRDHEGVTPLDMASAIPSSS